MKTTFLYLVTYTVAIVHHCVAACLLALPVLCALYQPWYIAFMAVVFTGRIMTSRDICIITEIERSLRVKINKPLNKSYVYHYYIAPFKRLFGKDA